MGFLNAWLFILGLPSRLKSALESYNIVVDLIDEQLARALFLVIAIACFSVLYSRIFGHVATPKRVWWDVAYGKTIRRFPFVGAGIENVGWKVAPENSNVSVQTISTLNSPLVQPEAVQIRATPSTGISYTFEPLALPGLVEFVARPGSDSKFSVHVAMRVHGQEQLKFGELDVGIENIAGVKCITPAQWQLPNLSKTLGEGWVSLLCDVRGGFAKTFARDGLELLGIRSLTIIGEKTDLAEVRLRDRRF